MKRRGGDFGYRTFRVLAKDREPLLRFLCDSLESRNCRILRHTPPTEAPFRISFETEHQERLGILAYAFFANSKPTRNRPLDEHRFQIKYGPKERDRAGRPVLQELWQDPFGLYTALLLGINPDRGIFVGADPVLHSPTKFFISLEFKESHIVDIEQNGWATWERPRHSGDEPNEVLVGARAERLLDYVRFERESLGEEQGPRMRIAERFADPAFVAQSLRSSRVHQLTKELDLTPEDVMDLIKSAPRLGMAVRGWAAEEHLRRRLRNLSGVTECERLSTDGSPDIQLRFKGGRPIHVECKNVLRRPDSQGLPRLDFQRTRVSKSDESSRYYAASNFQVVAACLQSVTGNWEFRYKATAEMEPHKKWPHKLANNVKIDETWSADAAEVFRKL